MKKDISLKAAVELGVVPTHAKFVGGVVPGEDGRLPRNEAGEMVVLEVMRELVECSKVGIDAVQLSVFPGTTEEDLDGVILGFKELGLIVHLVMMVGGADPMKPEDEDAVLAQLLPSLEAAKRHGVVHVASTSVEQWMDAEAGTRRGAEFDAAVAQTVKLHTRAYREAGLADSCVKAWHIEFLRPGEFNTFTDLGKLWSFVKAANEELGIPFFKCLVDAAHCGDSELDIPANEALIKEIAAEGGMGLFHASAKTTRGCLSTDDGWVGALLAACVETGKFEQVFVEMFCHDDEALAGLRELDPRHGVDTCDGRSYNQVVADGLEVVARRLNNFVVRGKLKAR
ncbi:hypothetical protein [Haloferula sp.]|uniref:hypothetical protein n=1 Tax=Haloferula sp. TaxID=2497595 RepID=UPI0032A13A31